MQPFVFKAGFSDEIADMSDGVAAHHEVTPFAALHRRGERTSIRFAPQSAYFWKHENTQSRAGKPVTFPVRRSQGISTSLI